ncbi:site-specific integrase [Moritella viscosa]|uniref:Phage integrase family protein n=1 Tax=Moritella viscosa TaxID=80854 RepID=A0ABY1H625_9GAMM|nr:site-specific integrase [Moritella viscosa]SGY81383.1 Phage integrase family protein [Moritella viscosa]SGY81549.1 Phage integrase family protein [Moritella viscosa]SHO23999.1 Phage integrase family protein [Moritella viscosa]
MQSRKFKFNKRQMDNLPPTPPDSRSRETEYTDEGCSGLKLIVNRQGRKRYLFRYTISGTKKSLQLGEYPSLDIPTARQIANEHKKQLALGNDPKQLRDEKQIVFTFYEFAEQHYLPYARVNKLTAYSDESNLKMHFYPHWKGKALTKVSQHDIQKRLDELLVNRKPATINRLRSLVLRMFRLAMEWGFVEKHPGTYIKKLKENNLKQRFLSKDEVTQFITACNNEPSRTQGNALKFALLTGMRMGEICNSKWCNLTVDDVGEGSLFLPHTKSGLSRTVLLNSLAMTVLEEQKHQRIKGNDYIFPGDAEGKPISHPKKSFARIKKVAGGLDGLRIHDLRHSFASILINSGKATLYDVQHLLGHQSPQTSTRYAHLASSRLREVSANVSDLVREATK